MLCQGVADVMPVSQMLWPLSYVDRCSVLNSWANDLPGMADGMATVVRVHYFEFLGVEKNLIPYIWRMVLANVPIQGWIIDPYVYWFFYGFSEVLVLCPHYTGIIDCGCIICAVTMVKYVSAKF